MTEAQPRDEKDEPQCYVRAAQEKWRQWKFRPVRKPRPERSFLPVEREDDDR